MQFWWPKEIWPAGRASVMKAAKTWLVCNGHLSALTCHRCVYAIRDHHKFICAFHYTARNWKRISHDWKSSGGISPIKWPKASCVLNAPGAIAITSPFGLAAFLWGSSFSTSGDWGWGHHHHHCEVIKSSG